MVGGVNQDVVVRVDRAPRPGETIVGDGPVTAPGGKGANMAVAAARAGARVELCGAVGDDDAGRRQLASLRSAGVGAEHVAVRHQAGTGVALITLTPDGENSIVVGSGANATLRDAEVDAACAGAAVVLAQAEVGGGAVDAAARAALRYDARLVLSPAPVLALAPATLAAADPVVLNEAEAAQLAGAVHPPATVAGAVRAVTGARSVVVTLGAAGAWFVEDGAAGHLPALEARVVDTTGAGDVLAGTLAAGLAAGATLQQALSAAVTAAARAVERPGAR